MDRRAFLQGVGVVATGGPAAFGAQRKRPNILLIITDQQSATMMSCTGNPWVKTPAMDSLMRRGMRFEKAYAANPVCVPSRFSLMTGRYPSAIGMRENAKSDGAKEYVSQAMGHVFRAAGYETVYGGKVHLPGAMRQITDCGFANLTGDQRDGLAEACAAYLRQPHDKPFLLVASFINPHDICYQAIYAHQAPTRKHVELDELRAAERMPEGVSREEFFAKVCPPAPDNFEPTRPEPAGARRLLEIRPFKMHVREHWTVEEWRLHRWAYARLTERVDGQIGKVLVALREAGLEEETVVVFTSDHGDMDGAHRMEHKSQSYEEAARIPLMVQYPPLTKAGYVDREHLVSNGLDILPTLCDVAGAEPPAGLRGRSFRLLLGGESNGTWRKYLMIETELGRAVTDGRYKYTLYDAVDNGEMLCDLRDDPGEMNNLAGRAEHAETLERMRDALRTEGKRHGIAIETPA